MHRGDPERVIARMDGSRRAQVRWRAFDTNRRWASTMQRSSILFLTLLAACSRASDSSTHANVEAESASLGVVPAMLGASETPRTIDKGDGLIVETLVQGDGPAAEIGTKVTLEYTISYVPKPHDPLKEAKDAKDSKDSKSSKEMVKPVTKKRVTPSTKKDDPNSHDAKADENKPADKKADDAKSDEKKPDDAKPDSSKSGEAKHEDPKPAESKTDEAKSTDTKPTDTKPADAKPADAKPADAKHEDPKPGETKPSDAKSDETKPTDKKDDKKDEPKSDKPADAAAPTPAEPLKPVIVASTKGWTTPCTITLGSSTSPALVRGFARGLEA
jgi:hypothetical protein